uniref:DnaJ homolog dnj-20 n=1 Tax=Romanomermis culicivorax TaxID=13658 RepID=A0A915J370_ROMCU
MDVDDMMFGGFGGAGPGGMFGGGHRGAGGPMRARRQQDPPVVHDLLVSLEDVYKGCTKKMKVTRRIVQQPQSGASGGARLEEKVLTVQVKPGWKEGTKITFPQEGDQHPNRIPADVIFILKDSPHAHFKRDGCDLRFTARITLREALCGTTLKIPSLASSGSATRDSSLPAPFDLPVTEIIRPTSTKRVAGKGLPNPKQPGRFGDLIINFEIKFPDHLSQATKEILRDCLP